ncbi:hypothetical protein SAMN05216489_09747 [Streptomyces sp. 3213]|nr:hypothetical protein SAMN05216489_09747 [Streptomyces sp. 3213] [Streptomyces sp. 3213.3]
MACPPPATSPDRAAGSAGSPPSTLPARWPRTPWFAVKEAETAGTAVKRLDDKGQESGRHLSRVGLIHLEENRCHRGSTAARGQLRDLRSTPRLRRRDRRCAGRGTIAVGGSRGRPQPLVGGGRARGLPRSPLAGVLAQGALRHRRRGGYAPAPEGGAGAAWSAMRLQPAVGMSLSRPEAGPGAPRSPGLTAPCLRVGSGRDDRNPSGAACGSSPAVANGSRERAGARQNGAALPLSVVRSPWSVLVGGGVSRGCGAGCRCVGGVGRCGG